MQFRWVTTFFGRKSNNASEKELTEFEKLSIRAGSAFFGVDPKYMVEVQKREIFELVGHGFSYESIIQMSLEERRYYYHLYIQKIIPDETQNKK